MAEDRISQEPEEKSWLEKIADVFSGEPKSRDDLHDLLVEAEHNEIIDRDALKIMEGALHVGDMQVREIMVASAQMEVIKADEPLQNILPIIINSAHSRYPVIGESKDEVLGILLSKDLLPHVLKGTDEFDIKKLMRPAVCVPESKRLNVLLREFRENRNHMAIVIDEYGGVAGLVTIEDVLEEIVGDIEDEYDVEEEGNIRRISDTDFLVKALTPIEDFNDELNADLSDDEVDTIGGLLLRKLGHLPQRGEIAAIDRFQFKVMNADKRQIHLLRVTQLPYRDETG
ncbi:MAG TPA: transporter associated domain-containing protein [Spongiibacteraceae bacterium]|nr:transporter associated domain-containing protein [Spongiibacteraceae bacterium]